ncbi:MAG TPA: hypothetical protein VIZ65_05575 [Cellvibrionaceae bacterium]
MQNQLNKNRTRPSWPMVLSVLVWGASLVQGAQAANVKVMKQGLGSGTVISSMPGINCGADCDEAYGSGLNVTLTATATGASMFAGWEGDCSGNGSCMVNTSSARSVRALFTPLTPIPALASFTPTAIQTFLTDNPSITTPAQFISALPAEFKQNWLLMSRSESLQTGTAAMPRILLPNANAQAVFSLGLATHSAYPGAHPNAIEYMQWDAAEKNFRFHEIVLAPVPAMGEVPARSRGVAVDDDKCTRCHSTRNVLNFSMDPGTTGVPPGLVKAKNKPNWDSYDSWGGLMPFNRDRIYQGSVEAAAFRKIFNLWNWRSNEPVRAVLEQLQLQPPGVTAAHTITRLSGGANDGRIVFGFDPFSPVFTEPAIAGSGTTSVNYGFANNTVLPATTVNQGGSFLTLHHSLTPTSDEGRAVQLFDLLGGADGNLNQQRVADEVASHRYATGSVPIDVRPIALAINKGCLSINAGTNQVVSTSGTALTANQAFFTARAGMTINDIVADTRTRAQSLPRRKADVQKLNLSRTGDIYLPGGGNGLIQEYGAATSLGTLADLGRIRQEVFRRPTAGFSADATIMGGKYVDREDYGSNTNKVALYRFFLEPLGVSVDKWSMSVRGRSRTYTFADVFGTYSTPLTNQIEATLAAEPISGLSAPTSCASLIPAVNATLATLPGINDVPTYTDVQRIFNKSCIECHGGLNYPPVSEFGAAYLNFSENDSAPFGERLVRSHDFATDLVTNNPATSYLYGRITDTSEECPFGMMPCGGPALSKTDQETVRRWIVGGSPLTIGDPHITTVNNKHFDFQSTGEFVLLKGINEEIQVRQTPFGAEVPLTDPNTGVSACPSLNTAVALRVAGQRISYQPNISGEPDPKGMQLRIDGKLIRLTSSGINLPNGGRIISTPVAGGLQVEFPGGTQVVITPYFWDYYQVWYLAVDVHNARATDGIMGSVAPGNWLPALPMGDQLGAMPASVTDRFYTLYSKFADAWRVDDKTSLFDYAYGTSSKTFVLGGWPKEGAKNCYIPKVPGIADKPPVKPMELKLAQQYCANVKNTVMRKDCTQDVATTADPAFAKPYLQVEQLQANNAPLPVELLYPKNNQTDLGEKITFNWKPTADKDGDRLNYRFCLWASGEKLTFDRCTLLPLQTDIASFTPTYLKTGQAYFWKLITEDGKGGTTDSPTWRFATK